MFYPANPIKECFFFVLPVEILWQSKAPPGLDPEGRAVLKLLGQNQTESAQPAVLYFWRPCKRKQCDFKGERIFFNTFALFEQKALFHVSNPISPYRHLPAIIGQDLKRHLLKKYVQTIKTG